ncbi:type II secretion system protein [Lutispora thermophila]|uniref:Type IV pilus assembly protein PilA n=1 Tax=Lutispora thermophila DSM 19022 TaxID=1122184 RepID=A0A1M6F3M9_9FIRM|nr:prepilin-type N-terminal cleavage/methylation domain-containing protein [Lutispora thermophila]SHI92256.1 type IV pilus assembly protein PilA [Lutispora thermophila DSM 19022]
MIIWSIEKIKNKKGFTFIELVLVIAVLGILSTIAVPKYTSSWESAERTAVEANLRTIDSAIAIYEAQNGSLPEGSKIEDLVGKTLQSKPKGPGDAVYDINYDKTNKVWKAIVSGNVGGKQLDKQSLPIDWKQSE